MGGEDESRSPLKILILGGTRFIGLHMTAYALERGHTVTFFNRGKTKTDRYPEIERDDQHEPRLAGRRNWNCPIPPLEGAYELRRPLPDPLLMLPPDEVSSDFDKA